MKAKRFYTHTKRKTHEKGKRFLNIALILLMVVWYIAAFVLWINGSDHDDMTVMFAGIGMFPLGGLIISPNAVMYALKDLKGWRRIFTKQRLPENDDFYEMKAPSDLHKPLSRAVLKEQLLNSAVMIAAPVVLLVFSGYAALHARYYRTQGWGAFIFFAVLVFGLPFFSYSLTNFVYRLMVVKRKEYIAYHAIVNGMHNSRLTIIHNSKYIVYKYSNCVGMNSKDVCNTPGIIIYVPDEVYFFPDDRLG